MHYNGKKANIICLSNQLWDFPLWTNKKHVMKRLSEMGFNVLFVDPPINTGRLFFRHMLARKWPLKRLLTGTYTDKNVTVFSPLKFVPGNTKLTKQFAQKINKLAIENFDQDLKTILWVYHVELESLSSLLDLVPHDILVYDCVDNYPAFPKYNSKQKKDKVLKQEEYLAKRADIVFATAPGLLDKLLRINTKTFYTPNVGDYKLFSPEENKSIQIPADLESIPRPRIGFAGALDDYKFDKDLMKKLAKDYPGYSFVVIGLSGLKDKDSNLVELGLNNLNNLYFLGLRQFETMPNYYSGFDAFIIPYVLNDYTVTGCFPVKFHEGLAAGLPVIVTDLPAYRPFESVCYVSKSYNEFSQNIRRALEEDNVHLKKERMQVAKEHNWENKVAKMLDLIDKEAGGI